MGWVVPDKTSTLPGSRKGEWTLGRLPAVSTPSPVTLFLGINPKERSRSKQCRNMFIAVLFKRQERGEEVGPDLRGHCIEIVKSIMLPPYNGILWWY